MRGLAFRAGLHLRLARLCERVGWVEWARHCKNMAEIFILTAMLDVLKKRREHV